MIALKVLAACVLASVALAGWLWLEMRVYPRGPMLLARHCSWCGRFASDADRWLYDEGAKVTSIACPTCEAAMYERYGLDQPDQVA